MSDTAPKKDTVAVAKSHTRAVKAVHASTSDGELHAVGIWNLHVLLIPDDKFWVAQGLEIDYVVQGDTPQEAQANFQKGLAESIDLNLRMYGNIKGLLVFSPDEVLQEAAQKKESISLYDQITTHDLGTRAEEALPFGGVQFLIENQQAA